MSGTEDGAVYLAIGDSCFVFFYTIANWPNKK